MSNQDELIDEREASAITLIAVSTLQRWRSEKKHLPYYKIGGAVRYKRAEVLAHVEKHRVDVA